MKQENAGGFEGEMSKKAEGFVNKLQEVEELLISCRTADDEVILTKLFAGLSARLADGELAAEIEGNEDVRGRFERAKDDFESIKQGRQRTGASGAAEAL